MKEVHLSRELYVDLLRAMAIFIMVFANYAPYLLVEDTPFLIRFLFSMAAPLFIFLAGFTSVIQRTENKQKTIYRGVAIILTGICIDMFIWNITPANTFDVLYLIGASLIIMAILPSRKFPLFFIAFSVLLISVFLYSMWEYRFEVEEYKLKGLDQGLSGFSISSSLQRFLFDGWFPFSPWLSMALFGRITALQIIKENKKLSPALLIFCLFVSIYFLMGIFTSPEQEIRNGYLELFYPAKIDFMFGTLAMIILMLKFVTHLSQRYPELISKIGLAGRHSMFIYIFHSLIVKFFWQKFLLPGSYFYFILVTVITLIILLICCAFLEKPYIVKRLSHIPIFLRWITGL